MTFYRNIYQNTRFCLYATATGAALCSLTSRADAQQGQPQANYPHPRAVNQVEPERLPQVQTPIRPVSQEIPPVQLLAGEATAQQGNSRNNISSQQESRREGISERLGRMFRSRPTTPPVDPGMHYPKASQAVAGPPPAPGASGAIIPSIPPSYGTTPPAQQPGLFEPGASVNAIGTNLIPPAPGMAAGQVPVVTTTGPSTPPVQNIPELKALMVGTETPAPEIPALVPPPAAPATGVPSPTEIAQGLPEPSTNMNAPLPEVAPRIAPGEPSLPAAVTAQAGAKKDPFADLFPADKAQPQQAAEHPLASTGSMPAKPAAGPYTGLSLDSPETDNALGSLPPPPGEEMPQLAGRQEVKPEISSAQPAEMRTASLDPAPAAAPARLPTLGGPPPVPGVPESELSIPKDLPKLAANSTKEIEVKPAAPAAPPASTPPSQNDQQSKMEKIAARKDLKGLKGFCPVVLRDDRNLVDSVAAYTVSHNGHEYALSSAECMQKFLAEPAKYAPASGGCDVIHLALTGERLEGSLDHAVWYKGRLYLFSGVETMETFVAAPSSHATDD